MLLRNLRSDCCQCYAIFPRVDIHGHVPDHVLHLKFSANNSRQHGKRILKFHTFLWTRFSRGKAGKRNPRNSDRERNYCCRTFGPPHSSIALSHFLAEKPGFKLCPNDNICCSLNCIFCADSANSVLLSAETKTRKGYNQDRDPFHFQEITSLKNLFESRVRRYRRKPHIEGSL